MLIVNVLDLQPLNADLRTQDKELMSSYSLSLQAEEELLRQKSRVQWLKAGDRNSYFFKVINWRHNRSKILSISGKDGSFIEGDSQVKTEVIRHFQNILGCSTHSRHGSRSLRDVIDKHISTDQADFMSREVTYDEISEVCFSLHSNKAPRPDGFNAHFFKKTWHIVGDDVINAIQEFFRTGLLLKELNATILSLVLKANDSIKCNDMASKGEYCPSIPKIILNTSINSRNGHNALSGAVVAEAKGVLSSCPQTSTFAANLGNNGGLEDSSTVAPLKNILGKMKGTKN
ncbi:hypothetical protein Dsin_012455 [Dipteronia sinensis]|uniref:Uncharacterized protein n=1 Tax=Dipteronia sinensis TaxID=43782 RepID=A0AAE0E9F7_9ROSI|nr:hypothetical protein Dsin_012455 [Dipteronia sinensis]